LELQADLQDAPPLTANPLTATNKGSRFSSGKPNPSSGRSRSTTHCQKAKLARKENKQKVNMLFIFVAEPSAPQGKEELR
jgi:hypothetical protein